jgi:RNA polymerase sigma-70 factor, ECF subfamily
VEPGSPEADDLRLLKRSGAGDAKAFHQLLDRHADRLFRLAYSLVGNAADAEDVVQETLAGAYRGIRGFEGRSSVGTWLTRILVTQAAKLRRDRKRTEPMDQAMAVEGGGLAAERRMDLQAALEKLSPEHRQVLVLREYERMSYEEIAEVLGVPRGTVESRLHRARAELREKLRAYWV